MQMSQLRILGVIEKPEIKENVLSVSMGQNENKVLQLPVLTRISEMQRTSETVKNNCFKLFKEVQGL